jgi:UDP-N-acetyl-D-mannosaminuronic acid transferase (WecB/TagA/CpsF family)
MKSKIIHFFGIKFFDVNYNFIIRLLKMKKGYLVMPAASALVDIGKNFKYKNSIRNSTAALLDSGFFCILIKIFKLYNVTKFSGYKFIKFFIDDSSLKNKKILLCNSSINEDKINYLFLKSKKFIFIKSYVCPMYVNRNIVDRKLFNIINIYKPEIILINIGGGTQEILAYHINKNIKNKTIIICSGAAISFFTGTQAKISDAHDSLYLGWFIRFLFRPYQYLPRIIKSLSLFLIVVKAKIRISYL